MVSIILSSWKLEVDVIEIDFFNSRTYEVILLFWEENTRNKSEGVRENIELGRWQIHLILQDAWIIAQVTETQSLCWLWGATENTYKVFPTKE